MSNIINFPIKHHVDAATTQDDISVFDKIYTCTHCSNIGRMLSIFKDAQFCSKECFYIHMGWR